MDVLGSCGQERQPGVAVCCRQGQGSSTGVAGLEACGRGQAGRLPLYGAAYARSCVPGWRCALRSGAETEPKLCFVVPLQEWLRRVHDERASLSTALAQLMSVPKYGNAYGETVAHLAAYGGATDAAAIQRLQSNVMRERVLLVLAAEVFCCYILTDVQWARAIVNSYPVG